MQPQLTRRIAPHPQTRFLIWSGIKTDTILTLTIPEYTDIITDDYVLYVENSISWICKWAVCSTWTDVALQFLQIVKPSTVVAAAQT